MSSATEAGTDAEAERESKSKWSPGICSRCHRSHETVLSVRDHGDLCPDCFNVLLEDGDQAVIERIEFPADSHTRSAVVTDV